MANLVTIEDYDDYLVQIEKQVQESLEKQSMHNADVRKLVSSIVSKKVQASPEISDELIRYVMAGVADYHHYGKLGLAGNTYVDPTVLDNLFTTSPPEIQLVLLDNSSISEETLQRGLHSDNPLVKQKASNILVSHNRGRPGARLPDIIGDNTETR
ncbi:MAG: hypothetical protein FWC68_03555 [Oscillospiraceae bacterium]|nr:hypothetical protein [Oscillospiraceae bacterium]